MKEKVYNITNNPNGWVDTLNTNCYICDCSRTWEEYDNEICYNCIKIKRQEKINEILK